MDALAKTRWGYETFATGGNEQAAVYAGIPERLGAHRIRSRRSARRCGWRSAAQDKGVTPLDGVSGATATVIAAAIIGGASILGGRGAGLRLVLGAMLVILIDKVLREGWPITRIIKIGDEEIAVNAVYSLPVGAVPVFLGAAARHRRADRALAHSPPGRCTILGLAARPATATRL